MIVRSKFSDREQLMLVTVMALIVAAFGFGVVGGVVLVTL
jgi:hypothetical protein